MGAAKKREHVAGLQKNTVVRVHTVGFTATSEKMLRSTIP
jgi:hypothetical protein